MYEKFGEFNSYEEINRAAAAQIAEGDTEAILLIAEENGIDKEDAQDYIDRCVDSLCTAKMAAIGKMKLEAKELRLEGLLLDWESYITDLCMEDQELCLAVRRKGKRMAGCMAALLKYGFESKKRVPETVVKEAGLNPPIYMGVPGRTDAKRIIYEYYKK